MPLAARDRAKRLVRLCRRWGSRWRRSTSRTCSSRASSAKLDWIARMLARLRRRCRRPAGGRPRRSCSRRCSTRLPARGGYGSRSWGRPTPAASGARCCRACPCSRRASTRPRRSPSPCSAPATRRRSALASRCAAASCTRASTPRGSAPWTCSSRTSSRRDRSRRAMRRAASCRLTSAHARAEASLRSLVWRAAEALHVRGLVDAVLASHGRRARGRRGRLQRRTRLARTARRARSDGAGAAPRLRRSASTPGARFSSLHDGRRTQIDHVLASASLYARLEDARFLNADLREHEPVIDERAGGPPPPPPTIDSDHAPLVTRFG